MDGAEALILRPLQIYIRKVSLVLLELTVLSSFFNDYIESVRAVQIAGRFRGFVQHHYSHKKFTNDKTLSGVLAVFHHLANLSSELNVIQSSYLHFRELDSSPIVKRKVIKKLLSLFTRLEGIQLNLKRLRLGYQIVKKFKDHEPQLANDFLSITNCSSYLQYCEVFISFELFLRRNYVVISKKHRYINWAIVHQVDMLNDDLVTKVLDVNELLNGR